MQSHFFSKRRQKDISFFTLRNKHTCVTSTYPGTRHMDSMSKERILKDLYNLYFADFKTTLAINKLAADFAKIRHKWFDEKWRATKLMAAA